MSSAEPVSPPRGAGGSRFSGSLFKWCPEDLVLMFQSYLGGSDLAVASCACREFYFSSLLVAARSFKEAFGRRHDRELTRLQLFRLVDLVHDEGPAAARELAVWSAAKGYTRMLRALHARMRGSLLGLQRPSDNASLLLVATQHNQREAVRLLLEKVCVCVWRGGGVWFTRALSDTCIASAARACRCSLLPRRRSTQRCRR